LVWFGLVVAFSCPVEDHFFWKFH